MSVAERALRFTAIHGNLHVQNADIYPVNLPISVGVGKECVKGPCQDTIATLWDCNARPSIGTHHTMAALEGEHISTMLISGHSLQAQYQSRRECC